MKFILRRKKNADENIINFLRKEENLNMFNSGLK